LVDTVLDCTFLAIYRTVLAIYEIFYQSEAFLMKGSLHCFDSYDVHSNHLMLNS